MCTHYTFSSKMLLGLPPCGKNPSGGPHGVAVQPKGWLRQLRSAPPVSQCITMYIHSDANILCITVALCITMHHNVYTL